MATKKQRECCLCLLAEATAPVSWIVGDHPVYRSKKEPDGTIPELKGNVLFSDGWSRDRGDVARSTSPCARKL